MADSSYQVIYKAIADFSAFSKQAKQAKQDLSDLKRAEKEYNDQVVKDAATQIAARKAETDELKKLKDATESSSRALREHAAAAAADAAACEADARAHQKLADAQRASGHSSGGRHSASVGSSSSSPAIRSDTSALSAHVTALAEDTKAEAENSRAHQTSVSTIRNHSSATNDASKASRDMSTVLRDVAGRFASAASSARQASRDVEDFGRSGNNARNSSGGLSGVLSSLYSGFQKLGSVTFDGLKNGLGFLMSPLGALVALLGPATSLLLSAAGAAFGFASSVGSIAGLSATAVPALFALLTGVGALMTAFSGIKSVFSAYTAQQQAIAQSTQNATQTLIQHEQAVNAVSNAEYALGQAQQGVLQAQLQLNLARQAALRSLQDLELAVRKGPADEAQAIAALQQAKEAYNNTMANPVSTLGQREASAAAVQEAQFGIESVQTQNSRNKQDLAVAQKNGIDNAPGVVSATNALQNAQHSVVTSEQQLIVAQQQLISQQTPLTQATNAYNLALSKLSPNARAFVKDLIAMKGGWTAVKNSVQDAFFGPLLGQVGSLKALLPSVNNLLTQSAGALGHVAAQAVQVISSGPFRQDFATLATQNANLIRSFGTALGPIMNIFRNLAIVAGPTLQRMVDGFAAGAQHLSDLVQAGRDSGKLAAWFDKIYARGQVLWAVVKNIGEAVFYLGKVFTPVGDGMLTSLQAITEHWKDLAKAQSDPTSKLSKWAAEVRPVMSALAKLLGDIVRAFLHIGGQSSNMQGLQKLFDRLDQVLPPAVLMLGKMTSSSGTWSALLGVVKAVGDLLKSLHDLGVEGAVSGVATGLGILAVALGGIATAFGKLHEFVDWLGKIPVIGGPIKDMFNALGDAVHYLFVALGLLAGLAVIDKITHLSQGLKALNTSRGSSGASILGRIPGVRNIPGVNRGGGGADDSEAGRARAAMSEFAGAVTEKGSQFVVALQEMVAALRTAAAEALGGGGLAGRAGGALSEEERLAQAEAEAGAAGGPLPAGRHRAGGVPSSGRLGTSPIPDEMLPPLPPGEPSRPGILSRLGAKIKGMLPGGDGGALGGGAPTGGGRLGVAPIPDEFLPPIPPGASPRGGILSRLGSGLKGLLGMGGGAAAEGEGGGLLSKLGGGGMVAGMGIAMGGNLLGGLINDHKGGVRQTVGGALSGAGTGAGIGMMFGPEGALAGAAIGGIIGGLANSKAGKKIGEWFKNSVVPEFKKLPGQLKNIGADLLHWIEWPFEEAWKYITVGWDSFTKAMSVAWSAVTSGLHKAWDVIVDILELPFKLAWKWIQLEWTILKTIFTEGVKIVTTVFKTAWDVLTDLFMAPLRLGWSGIKSIWSGIQTAFTDGKNAVVSIFQGLSSALGTVWDGIKTVFEAPIKFIVNTVVNDGILKGINWVLGHVGLNSLEISPIRLPFAEGDWVPGRVANHRVPGSGDQDSVNAKLTPGEFVIKKSAAARLPESFLKRLNNVDTMDNREATQFAAGSPWLDPGRPGPIRQKFGLGDWVSDIAGVGESAWNATGGKLVHWGATELRKGAANYLNDVVFPPLRGALDMGTRPFGLPGRAVNGQGDQLMNQLFQWVHGMDEGHAKSLASDAQGSKIAANNPFVGKPGASTGYHKMASGGPVDALLAASGLGGGALSQLISASVPSALASVSSGNRTSSSTVTNGGVHIEHLTVNNPRPERASDSLPRTIRKVSYMPVGPVR